METRWDDDAARKLGDDPLQLRVYTSRLLGREPDLVLQGGGNTSVKIKQTNLFGEEEELLYVKGSGRDMATIEAPGFSPVRLDMLVKIAQLDQLSDGEMFKSLRAALVDPDAPNPSVESVLHAVIPFKFVDHTHADAVLAITNTADGESRIRRIYGPDMFIAPYVMPGFALARKIYRMTRRVDWQRLDGMILLSHGVVTFGETARDSYEKMIRIVTRAEEYHKEQRAKPLHSAPKAEDIDLRTLARLRREVSRTSKAAMFARLDLGSEAVGFANRADVAGIATRGPLTADHVTRAKSIPAIIGSDVEGSVRRYAESYLQYFERNAKRGEACLDPAPRWAVWPGRGIVSFGRSSKDLGIVSDIKDHTMRSIQMAEVLGGWQALPEEEIFRVEYWELQQAKLDREKSNPPLGGKVALVTGAASGIGRACAELLCAQGAAVAALDIRPRTEELFSREEILGQVCDVTRKEDVERAVEKTIQAFGGLDVLISNAGVFPAGEHISQMDGGNWDRSLALNLSSHQFLLKTCIPYLELGIDPSVVVVASKNVPAPGPGAGAYSVAKAGLTQLARVAALELAGAGIRVNILHPNAVFDTGLWTPEVLQSRAEQYGLSVDEYKTNNLLKVEVTARDVAALACAMAGPVFAKTTGAQIPVDGGNERVV